VVPKASVKDVVVTLKEHDIHRVYVCNNHKERRVIGVISLRDLLLETIHV
jgi:CBS domain-containing protein